MIDVQRGFDDDAYWGARDNPSCEANIHALLTRWREDGCPVVFVRHDSEQASSPLHPDSPGNAFKDFVTGSPDLLVKSVAAATLSRITGVNLHGEFATAVATEDLLA